MPYSKIPYELRSRRQWAISGANKAPISTDGKTLFNISVTNPKFLLTFEEAVYYSKLNNMSIGYVLQADDPFTCVDLDVTDEASQLSKGQPIDKTKWTTQDQFNRYWRIVQELKSYAEYSKNGKGAHVWVKGAIGTGMRRDGVEVYSQERYIICTGKVLVDLPIVEAQSFLDSMQLQMRQKNTVVGLSEIDQELEDWEIVDRAMNAANGDKFTTLCNGNFSDYPSQSEADLALMSIFTFYTKCNEQCRRLFRLSNLGQRDKAIRDDKYLNNTLRLIRSREAAESQANVSQIALAAELVQQLQSTKRQTTFLHTLEGTDDNQYVPPAAAAFTQIAVAPEIINDGGLDWPPGLVGTIAYYIYRSAPRPVKEVAIVAALGLMAGICGKGWTITQSGLNMYLILIARSGVGKEAMHSGISSLMVAAASRNPICMKFINFTEFASGPALVKSVIDNTCFVNIAGEWGRKLSRLARDDGRDAAMQSLRTTMTDLYQKSGPQSIVGGLTYSSKDNNIASVSGVAYSMVGETTPGTFYECLTQSMMSDGFLSRFNLVEYDGERPPLNSNQLQEPDKSLGDFIADLCDHAATLINTGQNISVQRSQKAAEMIASFELECDNQINGSTDESWRQMWNRAALKVVKLSALLSVGDNYFNPVIQEYHMDWALTLVRRDIALMESKMTSGDVGLGDDSREKKLLSIMTSYMAEPLVPSYKVDPMLKTNGIITRKYLQCRTAAVSSFSKYPQGASNALNNALRSLCESGYISEIPQAEIVTAYNFHGKAYRILGIN